MSSQESFDNFSGRSPSTHEYMLYFIGLGEGPEREVCLNELLEEMPYSPEKVVEGLENLEERGYVDTRNKGLYPVETTGFDEILESTEFESTSPTSYSLGVQGKMYLEETGLESLEQSLQEVFR